MPDPNAGQSSAAVTALTYAALLPAGDIPWEWLRTLTSARHAETAGGDGWNRLREKMLEAGHLQETADPSVAAMPPATRAQALAVVSVEDLDHANGVLRGFVADRQAALRAARDPLERRLRNYLFTGDENQEATAWTVPKTAVAMARAEGNPLVQVLPESEGAFVLKFNLPTTWEDRSVAVFLAGQFVSQDPRAVQWALNMPGLKPQEIVNASARIQVLHATFTEPLAAGIFQACYLLAVGGARCTMHGGRAGYSAAARAVELLVDLQKRFPDDDRLPALIDEAHEKAQLYDW